MINAFMAKRYLKQFANNLKNLFYLKEKNIIKTSLQYHEHTKTYRVATYCFLDKINIIRTKKRKQKIGIKFLSLFCSLIMKNQVTSDKPLNEFCNSGSVMP